MRMISAGLASLALSAGIAGADGAGSAAPGDGILAAEAAELAAWGARDIEAIMNAYAPEAIVMPGGAVIADSEALRQLFADFLDDPGFALTFRSDPPLVSESGEIGVTVGTYEVSFTDPATKAVVRRTGRHLMAWSLQADGQWRVVRQMTAHDR